MRIGIYGGTFNPPHLGHITAARSVFELLKLDKLLLVPAKLPPHKDMPAGSATPEQRLEMTALAGDQTGLGDRVEVLDLELEREGKSYTCDTLESIQQLYPGAELWLMMGTDMFLTFQNWKDPDRILSMAGLVAFGRTEADVEELFDIQREALLRRWRQARIVTLTLPHIVDISSTELRERLGQGGGAHSLAPAVYGYILREKLYGVEADLKNLPLQQLRAAALSYLKYKRIPHVLGTEQEAVGLAIRYGVDVRKAQVAALLHDCTKRLNTEEQLALCRQYQLPVDDLERQALKLLHAKTGAAVARTVFGVGEDVYFAIRWHTTGISHMSALEKIIYLADYIEPTRDFPGVEELRRVSYEDLDKGMLMGLEMTIREQEERGNPVHENTQRARDDLKGKS